MKISEIKSVVNDVQDEVKALSNLLLRAVVAKRIEELKNQIEIASNKKEVKNMKKKIRILQKPFDQDFYLNIEKATLNKLNQQLQDVCENISLDLINAEYFNFSGRLK